MSDGGWPGSPDDLFSPEELAEARAAGKMIVPYKVRTLKEITDEAVEKRNKAIADRLHEEPKTKRERSIEQIESRLVFVPLEETTALDERKERVIVNHWWVHRPGKGLMFYMSPGTKNPGDFTPQCNRDERITRKIAKKLYPNDEVIFVEAVYV
jgi:hypothetical protein